MNIELDKTLIKKSTGGKFRVYSYAPSIELMKEDGTIHLYSLRDIDEQFSVDENNDAELVGIKMSEVKKPKELLENFDTVEIVGFTKESENGESVVIGDRLIDVRGKGWLEIKNLTDNLESKRTTSNVRAVKITDKNGNVKWEREPKNHEVGNHVKWHEALLIAASGTPMHCGDSTGEYVKLDGSTLAWFDKRTNVKNCILEVWEHSHWVNKWYPYTPKKIVVDWTKVQKNTKVLVRDDKKETAKVRLFKFFDGESIYVRSENTNDLLLKFKYTELAEPNEDYMKEDE